MFFSFFARSSSSENISCPSLNIVHSNLLWVSLLEQGLEQMDSEVPANLSQSVMP